MRAPEHFSSADAHRSAPGEGARRALATLLLAVVLSIPGVARAQPSASSIELVESVPEETPLDHHGIRNTAQVWIEMLRAARQSIDIEQFYLANTTDGALEPVIREVEAAAARGVRVRIIAEKKFSATYPETLNRLRTAPHTEVRLLDVLSILGSGVQHAKYFVVDEVDVFVGSQNWDWRALSHINELGVRVRDSISAVAFNRLFACDWALAGGMELPDALLAAGTIPDVFPRALDSAADSCTLAPVFSPRLLLPDGARWDADALVDLLDGAKDSVKLQVLSYGSYPLLEDALLRAAVRGVRVFVLVSDWSLSSSKQKDLKRLQSAEGITVRFTAIPEHSSGFISFARVEHCKYLLIDADRAWVGTNNWSPDYFVSSRNAGLILRCPRLTALLHQKYAMSWDGPFAKTIDPDTTYTARKRDDGSGK